MKQRPPGRPRLGVAFLLAQLGSHAAEQFALALAEHDLTPPLAGVMRMLHVRPGLSQQQLAGLLGTAPSRIVAYVDDLESRGWISRTRGTVDRRVNVLGLTEAGTEAFGSLAALSRAHEDRIAAALSDTERTALLELLGRIADEQQLTEGVHPGYRGPGQAPGKGPTG